MRGETTKTVDKQLLKGVRAQYRHTNSSVLDSHMTKPFYMDMQSNGYLTLVGYLGLLYMYMYYTTLSGKIITNFAITTKSSAPRSSV